MANYQVLTELRAKFAKLLKTQPVTLVVSDVMKFIASIQYAIDNAISGSGDIKADGSVPFTGQEDFQAGLKTDTIDSSGTTVISMAKMLGLKSYTSAQEALLTPIAGVTIWNSDLNASRTYNGTTWQFTDNIAKVYDVVLSQAGTADPVVNQSFQNNVGNIVWTRLGIGSYLGTLSGAFPTQSKVKITFSLNYPFGVADIYYGYVYWATTNTIKIDTAVLSTGALDNLLNYSSLKIEVYP